MGKQHTRDCACSDICQENYRLSVNNFYSNYFWNLSNLWEAKDSLFSYVKAQSKSFTNLSNLKGTYEEIMHTEANFRKIGIAKRLVDPNTVAAKVIY